MANHGLIVVAAVKNPDPSMPGHVALVMPKKVEISKIETSGPVVIMAGKHNFNYISLENGFKSHLTQWPEPAILFYVNSTGKMGE